MNLEGVEVDHYCIKKQGAVFWNDIPYSGYLSQIKILAKLNSGDTLSCKHAQSHENISTVINASCGVIVLWWSWLLPAVAICDYHVAYGLQPHIANPLFCRPHSWMAHHTQKKELSYSKLTYME